jgi:hypothetical protein
MDFNASECVIIEADFSDFFSTQITLLVTEMLTENAFGQIYRLISFKSWEQVCFVKQVSGDLLLENRG